MDKRQEELTKLQSYTNKVDNDLTMILQSLQWDRKTLIQNPVLGTCRYDSKHKIPPDKTDEHEKVCFLRDNGYSKEDQLLPEPLDANANTLVTLKKEDIQQIIANASRADITFKKVYRKFYGDTVLRILYLMLPRTRADVTGAASGVLLGR